MALKRCQEIDPYSTPDDFSVRTFSCKNSLKNGVILGGATFAFKCGDGSPETRCTSDQIHRGKGNKKDWNCKGILKGNRT